MTEQAEDTRTADATVPAASPAASVPADERIVEEPTSDPNIVRTTSGRMRPAAPIRSDGAMTDGATTNGATEVVRSTRYARAQIVERHGGFYWGADFLGFIVALFFTSLFLGIVGAVIGGVGHQLGQAMPKVGQAVTQTQATLGVVGLVASLFAIFLAYLIGGYTAGRMARFAGSMNGLGVVIWTVIVAIVLGVAGGVIGGNLNLGHPFNLTFNPQTATIAGVIGTIVVLLDMVLGATLGGMAGERFHRRIDRDIGAIA